MHPSRPTLLALAAVLVAAAPASASTVRLDPGGGEESSQITYTAAGGEQNKLSVSVDGARATIDDPGASTITPQQGCTSVTPKRVTCDLQSSTDTIQTVEANLDDGNDTFDMTATNTRYAGAVVNGGPGNDELHGGPFGNTLNGDVGLDRLYGGPSFDNFTTADATGSADADLLDGGDGDDTVYAYRERTTPVTVDLAAGTPAGEAGEGDSLVSIESVGGGTAGDTLRGTDGFNQLNGDMGDDTLDGRGGNDSLFSGDGDDTVIGGAGDDDIEAGKGDDTIRLENPAGTYDRIVSCAEGDDSVGDLVEAFPGVGLDCEQLNIGGGVVVPVAPRRVTSTYIQMSIPCPAAYRDANGVCAGKLQIEPRLAFKRSASTRFKQRYGATAFRFTTGSARILVRLNASGRKEIKKSISRMQFTLRLNETATKKVRELAWTETLSRFYMQRLGILH